MDIGRFCGLAHAEGLKAATIRQYSNLLKNMRLDIDSIKPGDEYQIAAWVQEQQRGFYAKNNLRKAINLYLRLVRNSDFRLKLQRQRGVYDIWVPSEDDKKALLGVKWDSPLVDRRNRLLLRVLFEAALRVDEAVRLEYNHIRSEAGRSWIYCIGKGDRGREIPISGGLMAEINDYRRWFRDSFVFWSNRGGHITTKTARAICKQAARMAGVPKFHPHSARHYRAIELHNQGVDIEYIRQFLGHVNLSTTQIYLVGKDRDSLFSVLSLKDHYFKSSGSV